MAEETFDTLSDARDGTIELVSAYVSNANNRLTPEDLQSLIRDTFATLSSLQSTTSSDAPVPPENERPSKAEIRKSISTDKLISFEDGRAYKSLKRHLSARGLTPADYRAKWGLPSDYPMVHPTYSAQRSALAKAIGLGAGGRKPKANVAVAPKTSKPRVAKA